MVVKVLTFMIFGMAAIVGVWDLLQIEAFNNALIQFATAGVIPGTYTELTPGQMYVVLSAILVLAICLLFRKGLIQDIKGMRALFAHVRPTAEPVMQAAPERVIPPAPEPQPEPKTAAKPAKPAEQKEKFIVLAIIPAQPGRILKAVRFVKPRIKPALKVCSIAIHRGSRATWQWTVHTTAAADYKSRVYAAEAWRYAELRIRAWDRRIEQVLKHNAKMAKALRTIEREYVAVAAQYAQWRTKSRRAVEK